ncbi:hypothetical protein [Paracoccus xiamenensis]|uniref:hypothetical protein n=1 Tax=Paracoccus xiamenensis TaxID=2714901 RepID=UPI00140B3A93|nr:hypothetical protein [Paracoccus xiamenensis]NHF72954.1 hypothetical protein [Paracoccus xiamenensis]
MTLQIHLDDPMRARTESGHFNFINRVRAAAESKGWQVQILPETADPPAPGHFALHHMSGPLHRRTKVFRRCYYYPYWHIETVPQRWRWPVAGAKFRPGQIDGPDARRFIHKLRQRIMPGLTPTEPRHVLIPLQGQLTETRSFQTISPVEMVAAVARTAKRCIATLHPNETYQPEEIAALEALAHQFPNLTIGGDSRALLAGAEYVAAQNSSVAMDAYLLARPVVLFGQSDLHHIAVNVADMGVDEALDYVPAHKADYAKYLYWRLHEQAIDAMAPYAEERILKAMKKGGWPI